MVFWGGGVRLSGVVLGGRWLLVVMVVVPKIKNNEKLNRGRDGAKYTTKNSLHPTHYYWLQSKATTHTFWIVQNKRTKTLL